MAFVQVLWCNTGNRPMGPGAIAAIIPTVRALFFFYNTHDKGRLPAITHFYTDAWGPIAALS